MLTASLEAVHGYSDNLYTGSRSTAAFLGRFSIMQPYLHMYLHLGHAGDQLTMVTVYQSHKIMKVQFGPFKTVSHVHYTGKNLSFIM